MALTPALTKSQPVDLVTCSSYDYFYIIQDTWIKLLHNLFWGSITDDLGAYLGHIFVYKKKSQRYIFTFTALFWSDVFWQSPHSTEGCQMYTARICEINSKKTAAVVAKTFMLKRGEFYRLNLNF